MNIKNFISMQWFTERKPNPAHRHSEYDLFYLNLTRRLYKRIDKFIKQHNIPLLEYSKEEIRELAFLISGYAEDIFNNIGIFDAMRQHFKFKFGSPLPIIKSVSSEYNEGDIQLEDIRFLTWYFHVISKEENGCKPILNPDSSALIKLCEDIFEELDSLEEFAATDFYNDYFTIPDDAEYISVKMKITFFTLKNYLTGFLISKKQHEDISEYIDTFNPKNKTSIEWLKRYDYAMQDVYAFETPLPLGTLTSSQLFARTARCSEKMRTQIENLVVRHYGIFHLQSQDSRYYYFHHTGTSKDYKVLKKSFNHELDSKESEMWIMTLIEWNGEYELTGICMPSVYKADEIRAENLKMQNKFYVFDEDIRNTLNEMASEFSHSAQRFFGKRLVSYDNKTELENSVNNFMKWHQSEMQKKYADKNKPSKEPVEVPEFKMDFGEEEDIALFIPENDNIELIFGHAFLINLINTPAEKWSKRDRNELCSMILADDISADYIKFLYKEYPQGYWRHALYLSSDVNEHLLDFMLHFYKPYDFKFRKAPHFTAIDSSIYTKRDLKKAFK